MSKYNIAEPGYVLAMQIYSETWERSGIRNKMPVSKAVEFKKQYYETIPIKKSSG